MPMLPQTRGTSGPLSQRLHELGVVSTGQVAALHRGHLTIRWGRFPQALAKEVQVAPSHNNVAWLIDPLEFLVDTAYGKFW